MNKMDKIGADFFAAVQTLRDKLGAKAVAIQVPIGAESDFKGIIDLLTMEAFYWTDDNGLTIERAEIPSHLKDLCETCLLYTSRCV